MVNSEEKLYEKCAGANIPSSRAMRRLLPAIKYGLKPSKFVNFHPRFSVSENTEIYTVLLFLKTNKK